MASGKEQEISKEELDAGQKESASEEELPVEEGTLIPIMLVRLIDKGAQGKVFEAKRGDNGKTVAVKCIDLSLDIKIRDKQLTLLPLRFKEIKHLRHPNLVRHFHNQITSVTTQNDVPTYQIIMEFCEGPTLHNLAKTFTIPPNLLQKWTRQLVDGLAYLHKNRIVHRDIKCSNIMTTSKDPVISNIKIADLGDVQRLMAESTQTKEVSHNKGTWASMSPEIITGADKQNETLTTGDNSVQNSYSEESTESQPEGSEDINHSGKKVRLGRKTDIWSLGCVVIGMINGGLPEFHRDGKSVGFDMAVMYFVGTGGSPTIPGTLPNEVKHFIEQCIRRNPNDRPLAETLKKHAFLTAAETDVARWVLPSCAAK